VTLRLVGETEEAMVQTRWKDRDGRPTIVEASHLSRVERPAAAPTNDEADERRGRRRRRLKPPPLRHVRRPEMRRRPRIV
jgi:hypothetical protein